MSRALNGFPEVSERTRQRVLEVARELDYRPNPSAASLATGRARAVGHVIPIAEHEMINPHFADFLAGAGMVYANAGYDLIMRVVPAAEEEAVYRDFAQRRRVDGVVISGPLVDESRIALLQELRIPFVVHGRSNASAENYAYLDVNNERAFERLTGHLIELGHRRIALINGLETMNFAARRRAGYERALRSAGVDPDPRLMASADMVEPYGHAATQRMLGLDEAPTAFVHSSVLTAMGGVRAIADAGLEAGADIAVACFDDCLSFLQPPDRSAEPFRFTAMRSSIHEAGRRVAGMLLEQIGSENGAAPRQEIWEAQFVAGDTAGPAR